MARGKSVTSPEKRAAPSGEDDSVDEKKAKLSKDEVYTSAMFKVELKDAETTFSALEKFVEVGWSSVQPADDTGDEKGDGAKKEKEGKTKEEYDLAKEYSRTSPDCTEILELLQAKGHKDTELHLIHSALEILLLRSADAVSGVKITVASVTKSVMTHLGSFYSAFANRRRAAHVKSALRVLTVLASHGSVPAGELELMFDFSHSAVHALLRRRDVKDTTDVRSTYIQFIVALLMNGSNGTVSHLAERRGCLNELLQGLPSDTFKSIWLLLSTLQDKVIQNLQVTKTIKCGLFNEKTLGNLLKLYNWKGPQTWKQATDSSSEVDTASLSEKGAVRQLVHTLMMTLCTDVKLGVTFHDKLLGTSGRNSNHIISSLLQRVGLPTGSDSKLLADLVVGAIHACPDLLIRYFTTRLVSSFTPRSHENWERAVNFLIRIYASLRPVPGAFKTKEALTPDQLVTMATVWCSPPNLVMNLLNQGLKAPEVGVRVRSLHVIKSILSRALAVIQFWKSAEFPSLHRGHDLPRLIASFQESLLRLLPAFRQIGELWQSLSEKKPKASEDDIDGEEENTAAPADGKMETTTAPAAGQCDLSLPLVEVVDLFTQVIPSVLVEHQTILTPIKVLEVVAKATTSGRFSGEVTGRAMDLLSRMEDSSLNVLCEKSPSGETGLWILLSAVTESQSQLHIEEETEGKSTSRSPLSHYLTKLISKSGLFENMQEELAIWLKTLTMAIPSHGAPSPSHDAQLVAESSLSPVSVLHSTLVSLLSNPYPSLDALQMWYRRAKLLDHSDSDDDDDDSDNPSFSPLTSAICQLWSDTCKTPQKGDPVVKDLGQAIGTALLQILSSQQSCGCLLAYIKDNLRHVENGALTIIRRLEKGHTEESAVKFLGLAVDDPVAVEFGLQLHRMNFIQDQESSPEKSTEMREAVAWSLQYLKAQQSSALGRCFNLLLHHCMLYDWVTVRGNTDADMLEEPVLPLLLYFLNVPTNINDSYIINSYKTDDVPDCGIRMTEEYEKLCAVESFVVPPAHDFMTSSNPMWRKALWSLIGRFVGLPQGVTFMWKQSKWLATVWIIRVAVQRMLDLVPDGDGLSSFIERPPKEKPGVYTPNEGYAMIHFLFSNILSWGSLKSRPSIKLEVAFSECVTLVIQSLPADLLRREALSVARKVCDWYHSLWWKPSKDEKGMGLADGCVIMSFSGKAPRKGIPVARTLPIIKLLEKFPASISLVAIEMPEVICSLWRESLPPGLIERFAYLIREYDDIWKSFGKALNGQKCSLLEGDCARPLFIAFLERLYYNIRSSGKDGDDYEEFNLFHISSNLWHDQILAAVVLRLEPLPEHALTLARLLLLTCRGFKDVAQNGWLRVHPGFPVSRYNGSGNEDVERRMKSDTGALFRLCSQIALLPPQSFELADDCMVRRNPPDVEELQGRPLDICVETLKRLPKLELADDVVTDMAGQICEMVGMISDDVAFKDWSKDWIMYILKSKFTDPMLMKTLSYLMAAPGVSDEKRVTSSNWETPPACPPKLIFDMITSHSLFVDTIMDRSNACREPILSILASLLERDPAMLATQEDVEKRVPLWLCAYGGTLHSSDRALLSIIKKYDAAGMIKEKNRPLMFGEKALNHYSSSGSAAMTLRQTPVTNVLELLNRERLRKTTLRLPLRSGPTADRLTLPAYERDIGKLPGCAYKMKPYEIDAEGKTKEDDVADMFDPYFVATLLADCLRPDRQVPVEDMVERGCLSFLLSCLSSHSRPVRSAASYSLLQLSAAIELLALRRLRLVNQLVHLVRHSLTEDIQKIPCVVSVFLVKCMDVLQDPSSKMFSTISKFLISRPTLDLRQVPEFLKLFNSSAIEYRVERLWILDLLQKGLRETADYHVCERRSVFTALFSYYDSTLADNPATRAAVVRVLSQAASVKAITTELLRTHNIIGWMMASPLKKRQGDALDWLKLLRSLWVTMLIDRKTPLTELMVSQSKMALSMLLQYKHKSDEFYEKLADFLYLIFREEEKIGGLLRAKKGRSKAATSKAKLKQAAAEVTRYRAGISLDTVANQALSFNPPSDVRNRLLCSPWVHYTANMEDKDYSSEVEEESDGEDLPSHF